MGLSIETLCVTCKKAAPWLNDGDGGFVGNLSLSQEARKPAMGPQNFGYIYAAFEGLGLVTHDWYLFRQFLATHEGHELVTSTDGEGVADLDEYEDAAEDERLDEAPEGWVFAAVEARCHDCRKRYRTEGAAYVRPGEESAVTPEAVTRLKRVLPALPDNLYRCEPFDELAPLVGFLERHPDHRTTIRVLPEEEE